GGACGAGAAFVLTPRAVRAYFEAPPDNSLRTAWDRLALGAATVVATAVGRLNGATAPRIASLWLQTSNPGRRGG
ncbi:hypothetical protein KDA06_05435, partial [Candidatus Saccharibacteria bacterium]|nr:hypothetical protein [Candidatus Saccharibacteria bacterium]